MPHSTSQNAEQDHVIATILDRESGAHHNLILDPETAASRPENSDVKDSYRFEHRPEIGDPIIVEASKKLVEDGELKAPCPVCECRFLYRQRDFNRGLGMGIVAFAATAGVIWAFVQGTIFPLVGCLLAATIIDGVIYALLPEVFVCYQCLTCFRNIRKADEVEPFDLEIADGFKFSQKTDA